MEAPVTVENRPEPGGEDGEDRGAMTLAEAQKAVDAWISRFEEGYWPPLANLARLVEEVGELAREINHRHGSKPKKADEDDADLALELGDVLFVLIALANEQGIDLAAAFEKILEKYEARDSGRWKPRTR
jgi:NTP pyrophosphatase (non-canonical NTP hydrolase)